MRACVATPLLWITLWLPVSSSSSLFQNALKRTKWATTCRIGSNNKSRKRSNPSSNNFWDSQGVGDGSSSSPAAPTTEPIRVGSLLSDMVRNVLKDPVKLGRATATGLQISLILYFGVVLWKTANELVQEFSQLTSLSASSSSPDDEEATPSGQYFSSSEIASTLDFVAEFDDPYDINCQSPCTTLAKRLLLAGVQLRDDGSDLRSIQFLLHHLSRSELSVLSQCLYVPTRNKNGSRDDWNNVVGLRDVQENLQQTLRGLSKNSRQSPFGSLFDSSGASGGGVLLYGPPGCGKTMLVKALVRKAKLPCLIVTPSLLLRKYFGESNQQVRSLFSLAKKLAPCMVCIDELDGLFRERNGSEHEASREMKTEFLQWWDGICSSDQDQHRVLVVGATNRPFDVDPAVLRRLPQSYYVGLPNHSSRLDLLTKMLETVPKDRDLNLESISLRMEGYTPSDCRQVLQTAALSGPMKEGNNPSLTTEDVLEALNVVHSTQTVLSDSYVQALAKFAKRDVSSSSSSVWKTEQGNYYDIGTLEIDHDTFDQLMDVAEQLEQQQEDTEDWSDDDGM